MSIKDFLFPKLCLGCSALGSYICLNCQKKLISIKKDICIYCGHGSYMGLTHPGCKKRNGIDGYVSFYVYNSFMQKIIKHIKYRLVTDVFMEFKQIIQPNIQKKIIFYKQLLKKGLLQPVPLHSIKLKSRGFNQALLIGEFFNTMLELPIVDYFERIKKTVSQAELNEKKERYQNIRGAFKQKSNICIKGRTVIILDDVTTTGFTLLELAKAIKKSGAKKVFGITLAKG